MFIDYSNPDCVVITHEDRQYIGYIHPDNFLVITDKLNSIVFEILNIKCPKDYISTIVGYVPEQGSFPFCKSRKDLIKVLDTLNNDYEKLFGKTEDKDIFNVGDQVIIKKFDRNRLDKYRCGVSDRMLQYEGMIAKIVCKSEGMDTHDEIKDDTFNYRLDIDNGVWNWTSAMLEKGGIATIKINCDEECVIQPIKEQSISVNNFITRKNGYKLNFNN